MEPTSFVSAFVCSLSVIVVSEVGDKTWCIACILAMRYSWSGVFIGAMMANAAMTVASVLIGRTTHLLPRSIIDPVSIGLLVVFGLGMLREAYLMDDDDDELDEAEEAVEQRENKLQAERTSISWSTVLMESFSLTFFGEWGDRSQVTTVALAARKDVMGVTLGAVSGHIICTALAVVGGSLMAHTISVRTVTAVGGVLFLVFAISALIFDEE